MYTQSHNHRVLEEAVYYYDTTEGPQKTAYIYIYTCRPATANTQSGLVRDTDIRQ